MLNRKPKSFLANIFYFVNQVNLYRISINIDSEVTELTDINYEYSQIDEMLTTT